MEQEQEVMCVRAELGNAKGRSIMSKVLVLLRWGEREALSYTAICTAKSALLYVKLKVNLQGSLIIIGLIFDTKLSLLLFTF